MSLTYDTTALTPDCVEGILQQTITRDIVERTMFVHLNGVNEKNYQDYYARLRVLELLYPNVVLKSYVVNENKDEDAEEFSDIHTITLEDIKKRIGIKTNVRPKSPAEFLSHLVKQEKELTKRNVNHMRMSNNELRAHYYAVLVECEKAEI